LIKFNLISAFTETNAEDMLLKFKVNLKTAEGEEYPSGFDYSFMTKEGKKFDLKFVQVGKLTDEPEYDANVFVSDDNGGVKRFESKVVSSLIFIERKLDADDFISTKKKSHQLYRDAENHATATLIKNNDLEGVESEYEYRMVFCR
jgi:hypothetical protein